jgi:hypothetical protein
VRADAREAIAELGKGGVQHKAIQLRLKEGAAALGFKAVIEKPVHGGAGLVDLVLMRDGEAIACEVTVTNTIDSEVGNIARCLTAEFTAVAMIGVSESKLAKLAAAVRNSLGAEAAARVKFFLPDAFLEYLRTLAPALPPEPQTKKSLGYKVRTVYEPVSPEAAQRKEAEMIQVIAEMMRAPPP